MILDTDKKVGNDTVNLILVSIKGQTLTQKFKTIKSIVFIIHGMY